MELLHLRDGLRAAYALAERRSTGGLRGYLESVVIDSRPEPRPFAEVARPWQWDRADRVVPALDDVAGFRGGYAGPRLFWETMPRGHDKTSGLARFANGLLAFGPRTIEIVLASGDEEQASILKESMQREAALNPWLGERLRFGTKKVFGVENNSVLKVLTADAFSSFGLKPDVVICDEITHWKKPDLWTALWSGRHKMPGSVFFVITNAGLLGSWQHDLLVTAQVDPEGWIVYEAPGQLASWMNPVEIERTRRMLPPAQARRVLDNEWIDPAEESGYLSRAEVAACLDGSLAYRHRGERGVEYVLAIDYGPKHDRTVLAVLHQDLSGRILVDRMDLWRGSDFDTGTVPVAAVHEWVEARRKDFPLVRAVFDPYQMEGEAQYFERVIPIHRFEARGGKGNYQMAELLRSVIVNRQLAWYPGCGDLTVEGKTETLADELCGLVLRPMPYGYRFDHENTKHDDRAVALGMGLVVLLHQMLPTRFERPPLVKPPEKEIVTVPGVRTERMREATFRGLWGLGE